MRVATGADEDDDIEALEVTFDQFSVWMKSSSPLADAYRQFLGGVVDDQLCALRALPPPRRGLGARRTAIRAAGEVTAALCCAGIWTSSGSRSGSSRQPGCIRWRTTP